MTTPNAMTAQLLETSVAGFASAADALFRARAAESGDMPSESIKAHLSQRILELAAAVRLQDASLFARRIDWLRRAYQARGADETPLRISIESLRDALLQELPANLSGPVAATIEPAMAAFSQECNPGQPVLSADSVTGRLALEFLRSCLEGRPSDAVRALLATAHDGTPVAELLADVLVPVQQETGELWHSGEITVAEEHLVTEATREALSVLIHHAAPARTDDRLVLGASVSGNAHDIGVRLVNGFFRLAGWESIFLGADVPAPELATAVESFGADVVLLNATLSTHLKQLEQTIVAIRAVTSRPAILIGGRALSESADLWQKFGADGYARNAREAVAVADELTRRRD